MKADRRQFSQGETPGVELGQVQWLKNKNKNENNTHPLVNLESFWSRGELVTSKGPRPMHSVPLAISFPVQEMRFHQVCDGITGWATGEFKAQILEAETA